MGRTSKETALFHTRCRVSADETARPRRDWRNHAAALTRVRGGLGSADLLQPARDLLRIGAERDLGFATVLEAAG